MGNVPELLRHILESTLSQEASVESLEKYLPRIRDIIINLLHGLKRKQQKLRQKQSREGTTQNGDATLPRNTSVSSVGSANTGLTTLLDQGLSNNFHGDGVGADNWDSTSQPLNDVPPRGSSASSGRRGLPPRAQSRESNTSDQSSMSSTTMQSMPVLPPYLGDVIAPPRPGSSELSVDSFPPPPPPPKQQNALAALQRGGDLERRASRRYSAYQISKHLGASPNNLPMLPPTQNSPIPNRGRNDARESMRAIQTRGDLGHNRQKSSRLNGEVSPARDPNGISEEPSKLVGLELPSEADRGESPTVKTPEDKLRRPVLDFDGLSATLKGPPQDSYTSLSPSPDKLSQEAIIPDKPQTGFARKDDITLANQNINQEQFTPEQSPPLDKDLTVFLQYKTKVKKFILVDGYKDLSLARLQLAFIEKFAWNTNNNGVDLPEIYIQDPVSGVRHELEDLSDIKDRCVLVLNVEVLDEVKRHIDEGLGGLKKIVEGVKTAVDDQGISIQRVSDRQQDTAKEMARLAAAPLSSRSSFMEQPKTNGSIIGTPTLSTQNQLSEIQSMRRDLAVMRQIYSGFQSDIQGSMATIRAKANSVKSVAVEAAIPDIGTDNGRAYINTTKKSLVEESDRLLGKIDDIQDTIEDLRKDVVQRGVRPLPRQLETVAKDIAQGIIEVKKMQESLKHEQPVWKKFWEKELADVCLDREELQLQEELAADFQDDLEKVQLTLALVEQAMKEQLKDGPIGSGGGRALPKGLNHVTPADPSVAKEGVLGEVRALQPNHENRLEAIERAEKLRQKELESRRGGEFQKELGNFVEEGKLKKAGGYEEVERARKAKDERIRREVWERQNGMTQADASVLASEPASEQSVGSDNTMTPDASADI